VLVTALPGPSVLVTALPGPSVLVLVLVVVQQRTGSALEPACLSVLLAAWGVRWSR
jgi:hypothetical protein